MKTNGWNIDDYEGQNIYREGQDVIEKIIRGEKNGSQYVILGPKVRTVS